MSTNDQAANGPGSSPFEDLGLAGIVLLFEASRGSVQRLVLRRLGPSSLTDLKRFEWPAGKLSASGLAEIEATLIDQFRLMILAAHGVQADLFEGLWPT
jgi:hypothetical protein